MDLLVTGAARVAGKGLAGVPFCDGLQGGVENLSSVGATRVFCKRVRKPLIAKELAEYTFLKSAEEFENKGFNFLHLANENAKSGAA
ncbi:MAG: hypothetical protein WCE50_09400 [Candidatus Acidiferrum sp.]